MSREVKRVALGMGLAGLAPPMVVSGGVMESGVAFVGSK